MFTGIVEEIGTIRKIDKGVSSCSITVQTRFSMEARLETV